jgi:hypothetical protein
MRVTREITPTLEERPVSNRPTKTLSAIPLTATAVTVLAALMVYAPISHAFNFGNMMNPNRWMGGDRDRYDEGYDDYPGGPYGAPGFGYPYGGYAPGYGAPGYGAPGYGVPGYGAPAPGYGAPAYPSAPVAAPGAAPATTAPGSAPVDSAEVQALKRRVEELEAAQQQQRSAPPPAPPSGDWPSAPAFRPMNQY